MVLAALGALCPPAISVIGLPATTNLAIVAALIQIPLIRIRFSFSGLPSCPPVARLRWMRRIVIASAAARSPRALLLRPGRNHAVAARVRDRLPQMLVLIFEKQHQRALLRHVSSEQFHRRLQVVVGKSRNRFLQIDVRSLQSFLQFLRIGDGRGPCPRIRSVREHADEHAVLHNDQVKHVADGANALAGPPVVLPWKASANLSASLPPTTMSAPWTSWKTFSRRRRFSARLEYGNVRNALSCVSYSWLFLWLA